MSAQAWGSIPQTDDDELEASLFQDEEQPEVQTGRWGFARASFTRWRVVGAVTVLCALGLIRWGTGFISAKVSTGSMSAARPVVLLEGTMDRAGLNIDKSTRSNQAWKKLMIEEDLGAVLMGLTKDGRPLLAAALADASPQQCSKEAGWLFAEFMRQSGLATELDSSELKAFKLRFVSAMGKSCRDDVRKDGMRWLQAAARELEEQKPVMTMALVEALNSAGLSFKAKIYPWLLHESQATRHKYLGLKPTPKGQKSVFNRGSGLSGNVSLPQEFQAEEKWPQCRSAIRRIHNQGHCGSCWAFSAAASIDARLCIASNGSFDGERDVLSRLQATSCAAEMVSGPSADGCQGGLPQWPMEMMAQRGWVSTSCIPYDITGDGAEHFEQSGEAPPCGLETHCQGGYNMTLEVDSFWAPGIENYVIIHSIYGDVAKMMAVKTAIYEEGPVSFAFYVNGAFFAYADGVFDVCTPDDWANHAVYASGWGIFENTPYIQASNSWSSSWGAEGRFLIHPRCIIDVTIPGRIQSPNVHPVADVEKGVPKDPNNPMWPWKPVDKCPFKDGCITDMEGDADYSDGEYCESDELNGEVIKVVEFDTETGYDFLFVGDSRFSGNMESVLAQGLDGMTVGDDGIKFKSDASLVGSGFKICATK